MLSSRLNSGWDAVKCEVQFGFVPPGPYWLYKVDAELHVYFGSSESMLLGWIARGKS